MPLEHDSSAAIITAPVPKNEELPPQSLSSKRRCITARSAAPRSTALGDTRVYCSMYELRLFGNNLARIPGRLKLWPTADILTGVTGEIDRACFAISDPGGELFSTFKTGLD